MVKVNLSMNSTSAVTAAAVIANDVLVRGDGGARGVQGSGITCDDSDNLTGVNSITLATALVETSGGTGTGTYTTGDILYSDSANSLAKLAIGSNTQILTIVGGVPTWGGEASFTAGSVIFSDGTDFSQDNSNFFWDDTNNRLGLGTTTPLDTLHVVGNIDLVHTAAEDDDHALEIDCNAAGFGDVKALDVVYVTGAMTSVDDEEAILVNVDETASLGGEMAGYEIVATAEGSATISGYVTGINIDPLLHNSGTFGDIDSILNKAVDVTAALASGGAGNISVFVADNDTVTYGDAAVFNEMEFIVGTAASGGGIAPTWEYSTGGAGFTAFSPADGTNGLRNSGAVLWVSADLAGWATNASGFFEIRHTRTRNSLSTTPILDEVQLSAATEFKWDASGDVNVNSLTLVTALDETDGGTGQSTFTAGDILYASAANTLSKLAKGSDDEVLTLASGLPSWAAAGGGGLSWNSISSGSIGTGTSFAITSGLGTAYDEYYFVFKDISADGNNDMSLEISDDAGVSYAVGVGGIRCSGGGSVEQLAAQPMQMHDGLLDSAESLVLLMYIRSNKLANYKTLQWNLSGGSIQDEIGWANVNMLTTADIDAVKLSLSASNFDAGTYVAYGR